MDNISLSAIGHIVSPFKDKFGTPRQGALIPSSEARVIFRPELQPASLVAGLEGFSHVWLISFFHHNQSRKVRPKVHPPRLEGAAMGVLATRSPHRPNPIGLTLARLERLERNELILSGVDLIDGTPILDVKPYLPAIESRPEATTGWVDNNPWQMKTVQFSKRFFSALKQLTEIEILPIAESKFLQMITESLRQDPRPQIYKEMPAERAYYLRLYDFDIEFYYRGDSAIEVTFVRFAWQSPKFPLFQFQESNPEKN